MLPYVQELQVEDKVKISIDSETDPEANKEFRKKVSDDFKHIAKMIEEDKFNGVVISSFPHPVTKGQYLVGSFKEGSPENLLNIINRATKMLGDVIKDRDEFIKKLEGE